ncbi:DUF1348 family protein [Mucilaginibacter sp. X5P1]|uniref:DUF1348 family protein n=1 Tax=Mucilaginibacter sp. X5P1 TaxID=2723088 RepID=UPI00351C4F1E
MTTPASSKVKKHQFLIAKFEKQQVYHLKPDLWGALNERMAVRFEAAWHDAVGRQHKNYRVRVFQFNDEGLAEMRFCQPGSSRS